MHDLFEVINDRRKTLLRMKEDALNRLNNINYKGYPKYHLRFQSNKNQLFIIEKGERTKGQYVSPEKLPIAKEIAEFDYLNGIVKLIDTELQIIERCLKHKCTKPEDYYESLSQGRQTLIVPVRLTDKQLVEKWIATPYEKKPFAEDDETEFYTDNGERVRSKSEVLIANALKKHGIPYKYECPIVLKGIGKIHPDFTALNIRRRKIYYWEHLGKMDDPDYARKNTFRLNMYEKNGLFHGDSLITTRETSTLPLDTKLLERIIDHYLLN